MQSPKRQKMEDKEHGQPDDVQKKMRLGDDEDGAASNHEKDAEAVRGVSHDPEEQKHELSLEEVRRGSDAVEQSIEDIRFKMETFTDMVSRLLENAKAFFSQTLQSFEDGIVELHQQQMQGWEDELTALRALDYENEDALARLNHAQSAIGSLGIKMDTTR